MTLHRDERNERLGHRRSAPALQKIWAQHMELNRHLREVSVWLATPYEHAPFERVMTELEQLARLLPQHLALEEAGGYYADVLAFAPHLAPRAAVLHAQHAQFCPELDALIDELGAIENRSDPEAIPRRRIAEFVILLEQHETAENELMRQAFRGAAQLFDQLQQQKRQIAEQLEHIQQLQAMSDLFVGMLGHDLRQPLNNIVTMAALLERTSGDAANTRCMASQIRKQSTRMERLIQQLLDFARARLQGGIPVSRTDVDLAKLVHEVDLDPDDTARLRCEIRGDARGRWDFDRILQVIGNLVCNALQHGDPATPVSLRIDGTDSEVVRLEIHNGGSIPSIELDDLFSPFKPRERCRGLGLGLYIVDQIVRAHEGTVIVRSNDTEGTRFEVSLPRRATSSMRSMSS